MSADLSKIRNIGIAAHIDAGKTTTTERVLYYARRTHRMGDVDDGTTITDFDEQEQRRGITIYSAAVTFPWKEHTINLIDTPGHVDFTAEVERSLRVLDGLVVLFDAREGVEAQSETVWHQADKYRVPRICFINKMDRVGADFEHSVASLRERLHARPVALQIPIGAGGDFVGLIDLLDMKAVYYESEALGSTFQIVEIPAELRPAAVSARRELLETAAEFSDALMDKYVHDRPVARDEVVTAIRNATLQRELVPVLCGSSLRFVGVQRLLDAVCDFLPAPTEVPPVAGEDAHKPDEKIEIPCKVDAPFVGLVFKVLADKPVDLTFVRLYAGTLKSNSRLLNTTTGEKENVSRIFRMFAKRRDQLDQAHAGDIVAIVGPRKTLTGHTLCDPRCPVVLESIEFPETVISVSVEPRASRDRDRLMEALAALQRQDPTLAVAANPETGQTLVSGMGELHLEVMMQRLKSDMNIEVVVSKPRVSYRETVSGVGESDGRFIRQVGGRAHFAMCRLRLEPRPRGAGKGRQGFEVISLVASDGLAPAFIEAIKIGVRDASQSGILGGYPVIDWKATIVDGEQHDAESSELAFENAGRNAFYEAMKAAAPVLLEPIMAVEVVTPEEYLGAIIGDLNARKASVRETVLRGPNRVIAADVPLAQMFGYVTKLRSLTQGRATSTMTPSHYAPVGAAAMKALVG
jgi:elongation factor G